MFIGHSFLFHTTSTIIYSYSASFVPSNFLHVQFIATSLILSEVTLTCGMHGIQQRCILVLVRRREGKWTLLWRRRRGKDNIKMDLKEVGWGMDWIDLGQDRDLINAVMNLRVPQYAANFLTSWEPLACQEGLCSRDLLINYVNWFGHLFAKRIQIYIKVRCAGCCSMCAAAQLPSCYGRSGRLWKNECASQSRLLIIQGHFCIALHLVLLTVINTYSQHREFENGQHLNTKTRVPQYMRQFVGRDSVDGPGIESRWGRDFPHPSKSALGPTQPPTQCVPCLCLRVKRPAAWRWPSTQSNAEVKERV